MVTALVVLSHAMVRAMFAVAKVRVVRRPSNIRDTADTIDPLALDVSDVVCPNRS